MTRNQNYPDSYQTTDTNTRTKNNGNNRTRQGSVELYIWCC